MMINSRCVYSTNQVQNNSPSTIVYLSRKTATFSG